MPHGHICGVRTDLVRSWALSSLDPSLALSVSQQELTFTAAGNAKLGTKGTQGTPGRGQPAPPKKSKSLVHSPKPPPGLQLNSPPQDP